MFEHGRRDSAEQVSPVRSSPAAHAGGGTPRTTASGGARHDAAARRPLRLLLVEDTEDDALLVERAVRNAGFDLYVRRVQSGAEFQHALESESWDLVISDHSLPSFSSTDALTLLRDRALDIPFIVVSGTIDEETAVTILKAGAHDFVTKQNLARLGPAIGREIQEAHNRAERRNAQRDLQLQRDFLRLVVDANPGLIYVKDADGRITLANKALADLFGTSVDALIGKREAELGRPADEVGRSGAADQEVIDTREPRSTGNESRTHARTGEERWFEMRRVPISLADGRPQVLAIGIDVTERKLAEEALRATEEQFRQSQKMEAVGQLAGGIAHDFNNLLTAILGYSDLLLDRVQSTPDVAADVEEIRRAGERASSLTAQLLAFSRKQVLQPRILDLNEVVDDVQRMLRRVIGEDIRLETSAAPDLKRVLADAGQMHQVLMNLAVNARDAMPRGGTLRIETSNGTLPAAFARTPADEGSPVVVLTVADTGTGMPPEVRARVFEPFFTTKRPGKGTGLGLAMVYGVVTQTGGHISIDSEPGHGTTIRIMLPVADDVDAGEQPRTRSATALHGSETILLVEDEEPIRALVRKVLASYGYNVLEARDTAHAIQLADSHPETIHLLLSDIVMPAMSGPELAQRLVSKRRQMRVLYMSGFLDRLGTSFGALSPGVSILHKPFTPDQLARRVRESLTGAAVLLAVFVASALLSLI